MTKTTIKKRVCCMLAALLLLVSVFVGAFAIVPAKAEAVGIGDLEGLKDRIGNTKMTTLNTITIPLRGVQGYILKTEHDSFCSSFKPIKKFWTRSDEVKISVIITFPEVTHEKLNGASVILMDTVYATLPRTVNGMFAAANRIDFTRDITFNIPDGYYNLFRWKNNNPNNFIISVYYGGYAYLLTREFDVGNVITAELQRWAFAPIFPDYPFGNVKDSLQKALFTSSNIVFKSELVPSAYNDPDSELFELGSVAGVAPVVLEDEGDGTVLYGFYNLIKKLFGGNFSYATFKVWFWVIVTILLVIFVGIPIVSFVQKRMR